MDENRVSYGARTAGSSSASRTHLALVEFHGCAGDLVDLGGHGPGDVEHRGLRLDAGHQARALARQLAERHPRLCRTLLVRGGISTDSPRHDSIDQELQSYGQSTQTCLVKCYIFWFAYEQIYTSNVNYTTRRKTRSQNLSWSLLLIPARRHRRPLSRAAGASFKPDDDPASRARARRHRAPRGIHPKVTPRIHAAPRTGRLRHPHARRFVAHRRRRLRSHRRPSRRGVRPKCGPT